MMEDYPLCDKCGSEFIFSREEPFAWCECGSTEWGDPRPENITYDELDV
jgi:hypothetical protein